MEEIITTWRKELTDQMAEHGETFGDIESITITDADLDKEFDPGYGSEHGCTFTCWTKTRVYFPASYDGSEWVASVSRNPDGKHTYHVGG
jgi:hypothetical protein